MLYKSRFDSFIRRGGTGSIVIPWGASLRLEAKEARPASAVVVDSLIGHGNADNIAFLMQFLGADAQAAIEGIAFAAIPAVGLVETVVARSRRMLRVLGETPDGLDDTAALRRLTERILAPTLPRGFRRINGGDVDWAAGTVKERGLSYERSLAGRIDDDGRGTWLEREFPDHPGVDFFNFATGQATSVKTLDLNAYTYRARPSQIYGSLSKYLRDLAEFDGGRGLVREGEVVLRTLYLAMPRGTVEQMSQVRRAMDLAEDLGIDMIVEVTE